MKIGCLGDIIFEVSDKTIKTIDKFTWSGSVSIQTHSRHLDNSLQEFTGIDPDGITFSIELSSYLGVNPMDEIVKIFNYERAAQSVPLTIGNKVYGKYRWLINSHKITGKHYDGEGDVTWAAVDVTLTEYLKE